LHNIDKEHDHVEWIKLAQNKPRGRLLFENIILIPANASSDNIKN